MCDMLVKLYELDEESLFYALRAVNADGVTVRRAIGPERHVILDWVRENFSDGWRSECAVAFSQMPLSCMIALREGALVGFACTDATCRGLFGPTGVAEKERGRGIGRALLLASLWDMKSRGYAYVVIGSASAPDFYEKVCGAKKIEGSSPGLYAGMLSKRT